MAPVLPDLTQRILYRDALILIIDKPAGLPVHAGPGGGPNLEALFDQLRFGLPQAPALAHRLDRDTSGCLVLGRQRKGLSRTGKLFQAGEVGKTYWAVVCGRPEGESGLIDLPLFKTTDRNGWRMIVDHDRGQAAVTEWRLAGSDGTRSWLELTPKTGRTHQIRVHCAALGCPILGEPAYDAAADRTVPLHLLARSISLPLYPKRDAVTATAEPPAHMVAALRDCGWQAP